jgi:DNA-binding response OmpR family regulator
VRILVVEDETELATRLVAKLGQQQMNCEWVSSAEDAKLLDAGTFNALVIDLGLPGASGLDLIRYIRTRGATTPILVLTARSSWQEKVEALNAGADDYLVKPAHVEELVARMRALARRAAGQVQPQLVAGPLTLDPSLKKLTVNGEEVSLTANEFRLLSLFMYKPKQTFSLDEILDHLYPLDQERDRNAAEVLIGRLRRKIGRELIVNVRGLGYRLLDGP